MSQSLGTCRAAWGRGGGSPMIFRPGIIENFSRCEENTLAPMPTLGCQICNKSNNLYPNKNKNSNYRIYLANAKYCYAQDSLGIEY